MKLKKNLKYHLIGIGGSGMSALARLLLLADCQVSGSDIQESSYTKGLEKLGAKIFIGHQESNINETDVLVVSTAIPNHNPEIISAHQKKMLILKRAELLNLIMSRHKKRIAVSGTHGKTTTTAMISTIMLYNQLDPSYMNGAELIDYNLNSSLGKSEYFISESDESDGSFLLLEPNIAIITNIEEEHMNYFKSKEILLEHFRQFMQGCINRKGYLVLNKDDKNINSLAEHPWNDSICFFSIIEDSEIRAVNIEENEDGVSYRLFINQKNQGKINLKVYGTHNVYNSMAAIAVGIKEGLPLDKLINGLEYFCGTKRRFQKIEDYNGIRIYDDYAHHPTEVSTTLESAKNSLKGNLICVFQPHRYSRTSYLLNEFAKSFYAADLIIVSEIYAANEAKIDGITSEKLVSLIKDNGKKAIFLAHKDLILDYFNKNLKPGDIVVTMGAGDINDLAYELADRLKKEFIKSK